MPACPPREDLIRYLGDVLPAGESSALESHVESCPACRSALARLTEPVGLPRLACPPGDAEALTPRLHALRHEPPQDEAETVDARPRTDPGVPRVAGYEVVRELGRGGKGVVFLARDERLGRLVALKVIRAGQEAGGEDLARFRAEARALAGVSHANLVQVYQAGEADGMPYCAMEYVEGGNLRQHLAGRRPAHAEAALLLWRLADAVAAVHAAGIVHRDLKPENVLVTADGTPKVGDFGLARHTGEERLTQTGVVLGTPLYMAPEQAGGQQVTHSADLYALGAILYELLTGVPPLQGVGVVAVLVEVLLREPVAPRRLVPSVPIDLETICLKCLEKEPQRRYATAADLAGDLRRFLDGRPILARPLGWPARLWRWSRRKPALAAFWALAAFCVAGAAVGGVFYLRTVNRNLEAVTREQRKTEKALEAERRANDVARRAAALMTDDTLTRLFDVKSEWGPGDRAYLLKIKATCEELAAQGGDRLEDRLARAENLYRVAVIFHRLGERQPADESFRRATAAVAEILADHEGDPDARLLRRRISGPHSDVLLDLGQFAEADRILWIEIDDPVRRDSAYYDTWSQLCLSAYRNPAAQPDPEFERRLETVLDELGRDPDDAMAAERWARLALRRMLLWKRGPPEQIGQRLPPLVARIEAIQRRHPGSEGINRMLVSAIQSLADHHADCKSFPDVEETLRRKLELLRGLHKAEPSKAFWRFEAGYTLLMLRRPLGESGKHAEAMAACREASGWLERLTEDHPFSFEYARLFAVVLITYADTLRVAGQYGEACDQADRAAGVAGHWLRRPASRQEARRLLRDALEVGVRASRAANDAARRERYERRLAELAKEK